MKERAIWHVPLLIAAGLTAFAAVATAIAFMGKALETKWVAGIPWALAGASLTFTFARIIHARRVGKRELELIVIALAVLIADVYFVVAACMVGLSMFGLIGAETRHDADADQR